MRVLHDDGHRRTRWANGQGTTYEVAVWPRGAEVGDFEWRVSLADIDADADFSRLEEVDRVLVMCEGDALRLSIDGQASVLRVGDLVRFPGECEVRARPKGGITRDLNVMTRRGVWESQVSVIEAAGELDVSLEPVPGAHVLVVVMAGEWSSQGERLTARDAIVLEAGAGAEGVLTGSGRLARICLTPTSAP